jgi:hypothetical protein
LTFIKSGVKVCSGRLSPISRVGLEPHNLQGGKQSLIHVCGNLTVEDCSVDTM